MSDTVIGSRVIEALNAFDQRAFANGRTADEEVRWILERGEKLWPQERVAVSRYFPAQHPDIQPSLTLDEIREGLM